ncbi:MULTISPECIES: FecR domain-containing protein [unclassified Burkholderia]|uniref:FecR family protein n=1 Tax=unclassified Burkholderia TaxID=2613784 RepID=UPI000F578A4F|nr:MULTISPECIES: FecR domain-containing protein [unclassified Burkholderia]RQR74670.1 peptidase M23 [Burkholderia sp. Bp9011]RQR86050.1 peptidase M23 [Burkholderia sp. Bp9010]RQR99873.1 peptidase M23 [Burkholderia sp. Bp8991]RQS66974.1 peptidase M23 [Burkholderia sp. Bp8977]
MTRRITQRTASLRTAALHAACAVAFAFAAQQAVAQPSAAAGKMVVYRTHAGDTLYDVAARYLQGPDDWQLLQRINGVPAPKHLQPDIALKLPAARLRKEKLTARVVAVQGTAERASGGAYAPLVNDATLTEGDRVRTGANGFLTLELADGTHMSLPPDSQLDLKTLRRTVLTGTLDREFELTRGSVDSEVTHLKKRDDRFQIRSPSVVAGVRGTRFRVNYDAAGNAATRVEVLDGTVGVAGKQQPADPTLVHANFGSVTTSSGAVGAPVQLLPAPALTHPDKVQDEPDLTFDVAPLEHAHAYHLQLARDAGMLELFSETRTVSSRAVFREVPNGTYFVRISAIDDNGLEGMPHIYAFERRLMGLDASASPGPDGYEFRWAPNDAAKDARYRFVLSHSKDLSAPVVDQMGLKARRITVAHLPPGDYYWAVTVEEFEGGKFYQKTSPVSAFTLSR